MRMTNWRRSVLSALGGTRTPNLLIRRFLCGHTDPFRSVRDLGRVPARCSWPSEIPEGRSSRWFPAWLPAAHDTGTPWRPGPRHRYRPFDRRGDRALLCPDPAACQPEKRKVDSSILSLSTTYGQVRSALTSANAYLAFSFPQPSGDRGCSCVTVVRHPLSHAPPCASGGLSASNLWPVCRISSPGRSCTDGFRLD